MSDTPRADMAWAASERDDDHGAIAMHGLAQDLERELAAVTAERDALLSEINQHNAGCESACAARFVGADNRSCRDTYNGRMCPDCPRDWIIDLRRP